jgi:DNA invertase Pin-like site-specific DNA recombinase
VLEPKGVTFAGFFYDEAVSAGKTPFAERPQGRLVFHAAEPGDHVVITRLDRCFRSVLDGASVMTQLEQRGVFLHSLDYNIDTSTPAGRFVRNILLAAAELERDLVSDRTRETFAHLRSENRPYTRSPPMGWKFVYRLKRKEYRVCPDERAFINKLAAGRAAGASVENLAEWCWTNRNRIKTTRNFTNWDAVRWGLQARVMNYPMVPGRRQIAKLYNEHRKNGGAPF